MIYFISNEHIEKKLSEQGLNYKIEIRKKLDSNPFSNLDIIKFKNVEKEYVLKAVHPFLRTEIIVHRQVNKDPLTASKLLISEFSVEDKFFFILMEKIDFDPLYFYPVHTSIKYYEILAEKLAYFHLTNYKSVRKLKSEGVPVYGWFKYKQIISNLGTRVKSLAKKVDHEFYLDTELVNNFINYIESVENVLEPIKSIEMTLVHGDFDTGNLILNKKNNDVCAIDYGLAHIDVPIIDIAHLLSATDMDIGIRRDIFGKYFSLTNELYPEGVSMQDVRQAGRIMHMLFFLDWYILVIEQGIVPVDYFFEQIHNRVKYMTDLLANPHD